MKRARSFIPPDVRNEVWAREDGNCAVCGLPVDSPGHVHHRKPRQMGGAKGRLDILSNLVLLHPSCHLKHVEHNRTRAYENGWLITGHNQPEDTPLMYMLNGWVYLTDSGHIITTGEPNALQQQ